MRFSLESTDQELINLSNGSPELLIKNINKIQEIPSEILEEWRKIGDKGVVEEKNWLDDLNNSKKEIKENFNNLNNAIFKDRLNGLISSEKEKYFKD